MIINCFIEKLINPIINLSPIIAVLLGYYLFEKKIVFKSLYQRRALVIEEIYKKFIGLKNFLSDLGRQKDSNDIPTQRDYLSYSKLIKDLEIFKEENKIFLSEELLKIINEALSEFSFGLNYRYMGSEDYYKLCKDKRFVMENFMNFRKLVEGKVLVDLENEFKKIIGTN